MAESELGARMRELAKDHPRGDELRICADDLDATLTGPCDARKIIGAWARARRVYTECAGVGIMEDAPKVDPRHCFNGRHVHRHASLSNLDGEYE